ncbi:hypothetical protein R3P38DRAFT_3289134 [Favolaschia claudopus]|uniref:Uncharacterized protein n=1 Tax=Favolaschia claudopus TaxID=2862362 RepID=A0AAV9ZUP7_9AGAR
MSPTRKHFRVTRVSVRDHRYSKRCQHTRLCSPISSSLSDESPTDGFDSVHRQHNKLHTILICKQPNPSRFSHVYRLPPYQQTNIARLLPQTTANAKPLRFVLLLAALNALNTSFCRCPTTLTLPSNNDTKAARRSRRLNLHSRRDSVPDTSLLLFPPASPSAPHHASDSPTPRSKRPHHTNKHIKPAAFPLKPRRLVLPASPPPPFTFTNASASDSQPTNVDIFLPFRPRPRSHTNVHPRRRRPSSTRSSRAPPLHRLQSRCLYFQLYPAILAVAAALLDTVYADNAVSSATPPFAKPSPLHTYIHKKYRGIKGVASPLDPYPTPPLDRDRPTAANAPTSSSRRISPPPRSPVIPKPKPTVPFNPFASTTPRLPTCSEIRWKPNQI